MQPSFTIEHDRSCWLEIQCDVVDGDDRSVYIQAVNSFVLRYVGDQCRLVRPASPGYTRNRDAQKLVRCTFY